MLLVLFKGMPDYQSSPGFCSNEQRQLKSKHWSLFKPETVWSTGQHCGSVVFIVFFLKYLPRHVWVWQLWFSFSTLVVSFLLCSSQLCCVSVQYLCVLSLCQAHVSLSVCVCDTCCFIVTDPHLVCVFSFASPLCLIPSFVYIVCFSVIIILPSLTLCVQFVCSFPVKKILSISPMWSVTDY